MVQKEERERLVKVFYELDTNHDGKISYEELQAGYSYYFGVTKEKDIKQIFDLIDVDRSGEIEYSEFITASVNRFDLLSDKKLKKAFDTYDLDKSGKINPLELKEALGNDSMISGDVWI